MLFDKIVHNLKQLCSEAGPVQHLGAGDDLDLATASLLGLAAVCGSHHTLVGLQVLLQARKPASNGDTDGPLIKK